MLKTITKKKSRFGVSKQKDWKHSFKNVTTEDFPFYISVLELCKQPLESSVHLYLVLEEWHPWVHTHADLYKWTYHSNSSFIPHQVQMQGWHWSLQTTQEKRDKDFPASPFPLHTPSAHTGTQPILCTALIQGQFMHHDISTVEGAKFKLHLGHIMSRHTVTSFVYIHWLNMSWW